MARKDEMFTISRSQLIPGRVTVGEQVTRMIHGLTRNKYWELWLTVFLSMMICLTVTSVFVSGWSLQLRYKVPHIVGAIFALLVFGYWLLLKVENIENARRALLDDEIQVVLGDWIGPTLVDLRKSVVYFANVTIIGMPWLLVYPPHTSFCVEIRPLRRFEESRSGIFLVFDSRLFTRKWRDHQQVFALHELKQAISIVSSGSHSSMQDCVRAAMKELCYIPSEYFLGTNSQSQEVLGSISVGTIVLEEGTII